MERLSDITGRYDGRGMVGSCVAGEGVYRRRCLNEDDGSRNSAYGGFGVRRGLDISLQCFATGFSGAKAVSQSHLDDLPTVDYGLARG